MMMKFNAVWVFLQAAYLRWNFARVVGRCCNMNCPIWVDLQDSIALLAHMCATLKTRYRLKTFFLLDISVFAFRFWFWIDLIDRCNSIFLCAQVWFHLCTLQVKIKRKQRLVRKEIEPVIAPDDMKNAPTADGNYLSCFTGAEFTFVCSFCLRKLSTWLINSSSKQNEVVYLFTDGCKLIRLRYFSGAIYIMDL